MFYCFNLSSLFADIKVIDSNNEFLIKTLKGEVKTYLSAKDLVSVLLLGYMKTKKEKTSTVYFW